jgi:integrase
VEQDLIAKREPRYKLCDLRTQSKQLERISSFFRWCVKKSLLLVSFAEGLGYTKEQIDAKPVRSHTPEELQAIVDNLEITLSRPERFFIPLFSLYQGARENEVCQLFVRDIVRDKPTGLLCANITEDDGTGQKTKNQSSRRLIPIHPFLLELGLEKGGWSVRAPHPTTPSYIRLLRRSP